MTCNCDLRPLVYPSTYPTLILLIPVLLRLLRAYCTYTDTYTDPYCNLIALIPILIALIPAYCDHLSLGARLRTLHPLHFPSSILHSFCFFFFLFYLSPFSLLGFCTLGYIYSCTLFYRETRQRRDSPFVSHLARTPKACIFVPLRPAHLGATPPTSTATLLLLRTRPQQRAPSCTCERPGFVFSGDD